MPDAPDIALCLKLCRHNPTDPSEIQFMIHSCRLISQSNYFNDFYKNCEVEKNTPLRLLFHPTLLLCSTASIPARFKGWEQSTFQASLFDKYY